MAQQFSHPGDRDNNEDCTGSRLYPRFRAIAVADGLGGYPNGELASVAAVTAALDFLETEGRYLEFETDAVRPFVWDLLNDAHAAAVDTDGATTLLLALLDREVPGRYLIVNAGDCSAYGVAADGRLSAPLVNQLGEKGRVSCCLGKHGYSSRTRADVRVGTVHQMYEGLLLASDGCDSILRHPGTRSAYRFANVEELVYDAVDRARADGEHADNATAIYELWRG